MSVDAAWRWAALPAAGWMLWGLGGTPLGKWIRRFLWPAAIALVAILSGITWQKAVASACLLAVSHSLSYNPERHSGFVRLAVGAYFGLALFPIIGSTSWIAGLVITIYFNAATESSLNFSWVPWKWLEGGTGALQGVFIVRALL